RAQPGVVEKRLSLSRVVTPFERSPQEESCNFGQLLVAKILPFTLAQLGKCGAGNRHRHLVPVDAKPAVDRVAVPGRDPGKQVNEPAIDRRSQGLGADLKRSDDVAHENQSEENARNFAAPKIGSGSRSGSVYSVAVKPSTRSAQSISVTSVLRP